MKLRPLNDVLLVRLEPARTTTAGGIVRPDTKQHPIRIAEVLRVGPGKRWKNARTGKFEYWPTDARPGDRVVFLAALLQTEQGQQQRRSYSLEDNQALIRETDVLFVVPKGEEVEIDL